MVTKEPLNPNTFPTYSVRQLFEPSGKHFSHISDLVSFLSKILGATRCSQTRSAHSCISRKEMLFSGSVNPTRMDNWACSTYSIDPPSPPMHRETMPVTEQPSWSDVYLLNISISLIWFARTRINNNVKGFLSSVYSHVFIHFVFEILFVRFYSMPNYKNRCSPYLLLHQVGKWGEYFAMISVTIQLGGRVVIPQFRRLAAWHPSTFTAGTLSSPGWSWSPPRSREGVLVAGFSSD